MSEPLPPVCMIVSKYHSEVTGPLREAAQEVYLAQGGDRSRLGLIEAPGTFELIALVTSAANSGLYDGICGLGCVVQGQTEHAEYINRAVARGFAKVTIESGIPVAFGVITANTIGQARDRAGGAHGNKGTEAMDALLDTLAAQEALAEAAMAERPGFQFKLKRDPRKPGEKI